MIKVKFISEVSSNHSRNIDRAIEFINTSSKIGCDAVKFQLFKIDKLYAPEILKNSKRLRDRKQWELPVEFLPKLAKHCRKKNIQFSCTPFYLEAVKELEAYVDFFKIASYELLWNDLLIACALTKKPVIISTGMASLNEIKNAVKVLRKNNCEPKVLHCTSAYPTPFNEANLSAIKTIRKATGCEVGWSDHTVNAGIVHRAVHKWDAKIIEFHLDLDGKGKEFSGGHCWLPHKIEEVIKQIRCAESADGDGMKRPVPSELDDLKWRADPLDGLRPFKSARKKLSAQ
jgi:N-acetylneuraminate synthase